MKLVKHADGKGGYIFLPTYCPENITDMIASDFSVRDDDLFIVTYPKSGTTWTQQITLLLINNGEEEDRILIDVMPWLEGEAWFHKAKNMDSPRYIKSHLPYALIPRVSNSRAKYIYVARNPKDCVVSGIEIQTSISTQVLGRTTFCAL